MVYLRAFHAQVQQLVYLISVAATFPCILVRSRQLCSDYRVTSNAAPSNSQQ
jgi:hypothetical protein